MLAPPVGSWSEEKYELVRCYATIFASAMSAKWGALTYVDLFAGAGRALLRDSKRIVPASPLLVLEIAKPFSHYVFCELDEEKALALERRVKTYAARDVTVIAGDCNQQVGRIVQLIPSRSLTFCFVDPFNIGSLRFSTIERIAKKGRVDFLVLLASGMDANRNETEYAKEDNDTIEEFTGATGWRERWREARSRLSFGDFAVEEFGQAMNALGYDYEGLAGTKIIVNEKNAPLYRLAFFSKHPLGSKFWDECKKYTNPQRTLF